MGEMKRAIGARREVAVAVRADVVAVVVLVVVVGM